MVEAIRLAEQSGPDRQYLTDLAPVGSTRGSDAMPLRHLSAADIRILATVIRASPDIEELEASQILLYCLSSTDVCKLWKEARDAGKFRDIVLRWAAAIKATEYADMMAEAADAWKEFVAVSQRIGGDRGGQSQSDPPQMTGETGSPLT
jgi:hypothetical protein